MAASAAHWALAWLLVALVPTCCGQNFLLDPAIDLMCRTASDVCACSEKGDRCGWCSSRGQCRSAAHCTTTCRECPVVNHKRTCNPCLNVCIDTCSMARTVCACAELPGCGWCNKTQRCTVYPECTTTCEECGDLCAGSACKKHCFHRFRSHKSKKELFPLESWDIACASAIFVAVVMASAAGIGGGAVLVPLFTMLGGFTEHEAIPLSIATIFGGCVPAFPSLGDRLPTPPSPGPSPRGVGSRVSPIPPRLLAWSTLPLGRAGPPSACSSTLPSWNTPFGRGGPSSPMMRP